MSPAERREAERKTLYHQRTEERHGKIQSEIKAIAALLRVSRDPPISSSHTRPFSGVEAIINGCHEAKPLKWFDDDSPTCGAIFRKIDASAGDLEPSQTVREFFTSLGSSAYCEWQSFLHYTYCDKGDGWQPLQGIRLGKHITFHIGSENTDFMPIANATCDVIIYQGDKHYGRGKIDFVKVAQTPLECNTRYQAERAKTRLSSSDICRGPRLDITLYVPPPVKKVTKKQQRLYEAKIRAKVAELTANGKEYGDKEEIRWDVTDHVCGTCGA